MKRFLIAYQNTSLEAPEGEFLIGRSTECHLVLDDPSVSRVHAAIVREGESLHIVDKGSRNGVTVNTKKVDERTPLDGGDHIVIGHQLIRIVSKESGNPNEKTQGIVQCARCGSWVSGNAGSCPHCGTPISIPPFDATDTRIEIREGRAPYSTLVDLANKAIQQEKLEEAERLANSMLASVFSQARAGKSIPEEDLSRISEVLLALAKAARSPEMISHLFCVHEVSGQLMSRENVERLYGLVRGIGYLACAEMSRYLSMLESREKSFTPGERFVHRRLQGLVKLCS